MALSHLVQELRLNPGWAIGRALWGLAAMFVYSGLLGVAVFAVRRMVPDPPGALPPWQNPLALAAIVCVFPVLIGWQIARESRGRELASALATVAGFTCLYLLELGLSGIQMRQIGKPYPGIEHALSTFISQSFCVGLGATFRRWRCARQ